MYFIGDRQIPVFSWHIDIVYILKFYTLMGGVAVIQLIPSILYMMKISMVISENTTEVWQL